jgi:hypothetical protein
MRIKSALLLIAYLCVVLGLARDYTTACFVFGLVAPPTAVSIRFVEHLKRRGRRLTFRQRLSAYSLAFVVSLLLLTGIPFVLLLLMFGLVWQFTAEIP